MIIANATQQVGVPTTPIPTGQLPLPKAFRDLDGALLSTTNLSIPGAGKSPGKQDEQKLVAGVSVIEHKVPSDRRATYWAASSFDDAVQSASLLSSRSPLKNKAFTGVQPVAIVQTKDGALAITPLLTPTGNWAMMVDDKILKERKGIQTFSRDNAAVLAIIAGTRMADLREINVGASAQLR